MLVKGNCGGMIPVDGASFSVNGNGELSLNKGEQTAVEYKNINITGDAVINHLDVTDSIVVPTPTDKNDAVNKEYSDLHYITSESGKLFRIVVNDDGVLSTIAMP